MKAPDECQFHHWYIICVNRGTRVQCTMLTGIIHRLCLCLSSASRQGLPDRGSGEETKMRHCMFLGECVALVTDSFD